jgi:hypothetical protein
MAETIRAKNHILGFFKYRNYYSCYAPKILIKESNIFVCEAYSETLVSKDFSSHHTILVTSYTMTPETGEKNHCTNMKLNTLINILHAQKMKERGRKKKSYIVRIGKLLEPTFKQRYPALKAW